MFRYANTNADSIKLKLFPSSLFGEAKVWYNELSPGVITTWEEMRRAFDEAEKAEKEEESSSSKKDKSDPPPLKAYKLKIPHPQHLRKEKMEERYAKFIDIIKEVRINVPLVDVLAGMPNYGKFLKDLLGDPGSLLIPCTLANSVECLALANLGASINLMPYSLYASLSMTTLKPIKMSIRLANHTYQYPMGVAENMLIQVRKFVFLVDFVILEMEEDSKVPLILGIPFLYTADVIIQVKSKELNLGVGDDKITFLIDKAMQHYYSSDDTCFRMDVIDEVKEEELDALLNDSEPFLIDIISAIEFDKTGDHLATGDRGGRVVLFERTDRINDGAHRRVLEGMDCSSSRHPEFRYRTEFQSHEPEFDYLKSLEIEEKINKIRWCHTSNGAMFLLSTNDKTVKFWKVQEKKIKKICNFNVDPQKFTSNGFSSSSNVHTSSKACCANPVSCKSNNGPILPGGITSLRLPMVTSCETSLLARCRRTYAHAHDYHINSISNNSDGETFISADDLRINLWNLEISNQSFNIVDVKPPNMEDLTEVITSAEFHPSHCNMLAYSSSKGSIRLLDLRQSALCDTHSKLFEVREAPGSKSFFTDIISSVSDIKFAKGGRYILSRDYMTLKLWDINMGSGPVATFQVHEHLRPKLCDLYENDAIFDKFECCLSGDGQRVATGSYSNMFRVFGCTEGSSEATTLEATKNPTRRQIQTPPRYLRSPGNNSPGVSKPGSDNSGTDNNGNTFDLTTKLLHLAWHPNENSIACAASNSLYMYHA
ncbi:serine/threonine protein phosphatase 2A 55 kDa regulatory subunit B beta isoform-like protein isoform X1 [Tanacetum coccineum]